MMSLRGLTIRGAQQSYIKMQQTQQILPCVKHKLPEPNSILPSESLRSEAPRHIRKRVRNSVGKSSENWPLDKGGPSIKQLIAAILASYYGPDFNISYLLTYAQKIVFLNSLVHPSQPSEPEYFFGSISTSLPHTRSSICHPYTRQNTYELEFDDKIESGNLYFALQHQPGTYLLANRLDYNTRSYGQWFYFKVKNVTQTGKYFRFCIVNMTKNGAMFGRGLKVSVCRNGVWIKEGCQIEYIQNKFIRKASLSTVLRTNLETYYTLTFSLFIDSHETIQIAYNEPYTYSKLGKKLDILSIQHPILSRSLLCRTPLGNVIQLLTIAKQTSLRQKKVIFITARAHPIQTAGSYVMEGILNQFLKPSEPWIVDRLLDNYIIKIVPMINPDGVIIGNSRCNLYGYDLNRQWKDPAKNTAPQIMSLKKAILKYEGRVEMFLDLHGHSTKKSVFAYGCHDFKNPIASRQFPYILSKLSDKDFLFSQCRFSAFNQSKNSNKDGTARVSLWRKLKIPNIFTIQHSYCCAEGSQLHYDSKSYASIGKDIVMSLCSYFRKEEQNEQTEKVQRYQQQQKLNHSQKISKSVTLRRQDMLSELKNNASLLNLNIRSSDEVSSDSQPEDRIQQTNIRNYETPNKLSRNMSNKVYIKSRTEKMTKQTKHNFEIKLKKNATIQSKITKQDQLNESPSIFEKRMRRKYLRNLSPLTKQEKNTESNAWITKQGEQEEGIRTKRGDSQPQLHRHKNQTMRQTNAGISIIQIGLQGNLDYSRGETYQMSKAVSAKNINSQYGVYHNRFTTNQNRSSKGTKNVIKYLQNIICTDTDTFTDYHQFRQPVLKVKKNMNQPSNKLKDFINKINAIQNNSITSYNQVNGSNKRFGNASGYGGGYAKDDNIGSSGGGNGIGGSGSANGKVVGLKTSQGKSGVNLGSVGNAGKL